MKRVFFADKAGRLLKGFCPTLCDTEEEVEEVVECCLDYAYEYKIKYDHIVIEDA